MSVFDLSKLLKGMRPMLSVQKYHIATMDGSDIMAIAGYLDYIVCLYREDEGITLVFEEAILEEIKSISGNEVVGPFARITIGANSDLMAIGYLAKLTAALAKEGISANAFSAYHHDHLFVPFERKDDALAALKRLSG